MSEMGLNQNAEPRRPRHSLASECKDILTAFEMIFLVRSLLNDESRHRNPSTTICDNSISDISAQCLFVSI